MKDSILIPNIVFEMKLSNKIKFIYFSLLLGNKIGDMMIISVKDFCKKHKIKTNLFFKCIENLEKKEKILNGKSLIRTIKDCGEPDKIAVNLVDIWFENYEYFK